MKINIKEYFKDLNIEEETKEERKRSNFYRILFVLIALFIIIIDFAFIIIPDKKTSETENRSLEQFPKLNVITLTNGKFESSFDSYVADQFPGRDIWVSFKAFIDILSGKTESNNIYLAKDGYLIQNLTKPDEEKYQMRIQEMKNLKEVHPNLKFSALIAPTALSIYRENLPVNTPAEDEDAFSDRVNTDISNLGIRVIDVRKTLDTTAENEQVYYRTDHHWTSLGAYAAYMQMANEMGLPGKDIQYAPKMVSDTFRGTLSASSGFRSSETDPVFVYQPLTPIDYTVTYVNEGETKASFYDSSALNSRDHYSLFFGGNHPQIKIQSNIPSNQKLLIIKDSYANSFVPFMINDYKKIIMVDPRYYTDDINSLITSENITDVLYLENISTFTG